MSQELIDRWASFISKISERLDAIIVEAGQGVVALGRAHTEDALPLSNALTGLDHRVDQLWTKLDTTWEEKVEPKFEAIGGAVWDRGLDMKADARLDHAHRWQNAKVEWLTTLADEAKARADASEATDVVCTNCGKPLALASRRKTVSHPCGACGTVNQVSPSAATRMYYGTYVTYLAEGATLPHRHAIERFREEVDRTSRANNWAKESVASMERWRDMERAAYQARADKAAELTGDPVDHAYVEGRMAFFMKYSLEMEQSWVKVHGKHH